MRKLKHILPAFSILEHIKISEDELSSLRSCVKNLKNEFQSVFEVNGDLCGYQDKLAKSVYENFFQVPLTSFRKESEGPNCVSNFIGSSDLQSEIAMVRKRKELSRLKQSSFNELNYTDRTDYYYRFENLMDGLLRQFKAKPTRMRLVKLAAGTHVPPHIDYDPSYGVRIIIPIFSDANCLNIFWAKGETYSLQFKPGHAYFLNTGYKHAVVNFSSEDRFTLMVTLEGIQDIQHLIETKEQGSAPAAEIRNLYESF